MTPVVSQNLVPCASAEIELAATKARAYAEAAQAPSTRRAYASDLRVFSAFCTKHGLASIPATPQTVAHYVSDLAERSKIATIRRHIVAIGQAHKERGLESPTVHEMVRRVMRGITRTLGSSQAKKDAITLDELRALLCSISGTPLKVQRDRAILLLGFSAALRRSEIAALDVADLFYTNEGLRIMIRRSKTDTNAKGQEIAVPFVADGSLCAVTAMRTWLDSADITSGPVFRSFSLRHKLREQRIDGRAVASLVKRYTGKAKIDGDFSGHSLRVSFVTAAARKGVSLESIARTTRHRSMTVLGGYVRRANLFEDAALVRIIQ